MLIIRRRPGESVVIAGNIEVTVMEITASRVRLGIQAPAEVNILRKEIQLAGEQNLAAAGAVSLESVGILLDALRGRPG